MRKDDKRRFYGDFGIDEQEYYGIVYSVFMYGTTSDTPFEKL
ncbi:hypothetical protein P4679_24400 [Priestia megaterium]|nr:hypothetical protein [Priestia megaterium]